MTNRRLPRLVAPFAALFTACASTTPNAAPTRRTEIHTIVLVEAEGPTAAADAFVSKLLSDVSDRGGPRIADARLSGAKLAQLAVDPQSETARAFRHVWPGEAHLGVTLQQCQVIVERTASQALTPFGTRTDVPAVSTSVDCAVTLRLVSSTSGEVFSSLSVSGYVKAAVDRDDRDPPEMQAARESASKAAKKLVAAIQKLR